MDDADTPPEPMRCAIVIDRSLPPGRAANAAAVIALTMGQRHPTLPGPDLIDADGLAHPGLIPIGIAVLGAEADALAPLRDKAAAAGIAIVDFPVQGQETTDYALFRARVAEVRTAALRYVGVGLYGPRKAVGKLVGKLSLLA